ncbi:energy-coupled thiamine transporter ThiT [Fusibacter ferrireducens]|uniref:Energy-coupled thiamine transporter ThiT n=1 Tax=Fusibacter ferrireducens TaxID=2785058 RepID=A0ABR9ZX63_9FIRM|nr:energy-coupled thiamine transporter ThiT [Fusibacter ferrireducens]MBF4695047.1 energy-coupled thiamine transporter ThiT [Fusibacter ferrireducens]
MERNSSVKVKMLVEGAMMIAIATVLSFIKVWEMPYGGSVTAGSMVPILIYAYRWGGAQGILAGAVYGIIQFMIEPFAAHPISVLLDYPIAFGVLGIMGFVAHKSKDIKRIFLGVIVAILGRFIAHFLSGVIFFATFAPDGMSPALYSVEYNASYLVPEMVISMVVFTLLYKQLNKI